MTSTKSFPSYTQVRKDLTTEATATSVEDNADWGGIENLDVPQTESQAEKDAAAAKKAAEEEAMEAVENGPLTEERRQELLKKRREP